MDIHWIAHYDDGTTLDQREKGSNGKGPTYPDIDRDRLTAFGLYTGDRVLVLVDFRDDSDGNLQIGPKRLIWRRRGQIRSGDEHANYVHLVGWQRTINDRNVQAICYVREDDGVVVLGGQWLDNAPMMHAIKLMECEEA